MEVIKKKSNGILFVAVKGRLDVNTAPTLEAEVAEDLAIFQEIHLDFTDLTYLSSAGLRVLLSFHKSVSQKGGKLVILHPCDEVMEILSMTGFADFLEIEW